jgi:Tol biopolymer transport system component
MTKQRRLCVLGGLALAAVAVSAVPAARVVSAAEPHRVVFTSGRDGEGRVNLYQMDEDGQNQKAITKDAGYSFDPALSPDGKKIAFAYMASKEDRKSELYVINLDGMGKTQLTTAGAFSFAPSWSPDGKRLFYTSMVFPNAAGGPPPFKLHLMDADGKNDAELSDGMSSGWTPDGKQLVYTQFPQQGEEFTIQLMDVTGANGRQLIGSKSALGVFSPDGKKIAYLAEPPGGSQPDLYVADADGKNPVQLTRTDDLEIGAVWTSDGKHILFSRFPKGGEEAFKKSEIFSTDLEGKETAQLTTNDSIDALAGGFLIFGLIRG